MSATIRPGLYLAHKPVGPTSAALVRALQAELGGPTPVSHAGSLDPFAEGLLLLLVGEATRFLELFHRLPKTYRATVRWGAETDNGDPLGRVVAEGDASTLTPARLEAALAEFVGWRDQVPPATSAKKIGGEPAYRKAHRGEAVHLPPSRVYLHMARWLSHELPDTSHLELVCRGGYYVRALARDLGRSLEARGHLVALQRTRIGPWEDPGPLSRIGVFGADILPWCSRRELAASEARALRRRGSVPLGRPQPGPWRFPEGFADPDAPVLGVQDRSLVALLDRRDHQLRLRLGLRSALSPPPEPRGAPERPRPG